MILNDHISGQHHFLIVHGKVWLFAGSKKFVIDLPFYYQVHRQRNYLECEGVLTLLIELAYKFMSKSCV